MKNVLTTTALGMTLITGAWAFAGPLSVPDGALDVLPATPSAEGAQAFIVRAERDPDTAEEAQRGEDRRILINVPVRGDGLPPGEHTLRIDWQPLGNIRKADVLIEERGNPDGSSTRVFPVPAERGVIEIPLTIEDDGQPWRGRMRFRFEQAESAFEAGEVFGLDLHALQIGDAISFDFDGDSPETPEVKFNAGLAGQLTEVLPADEEERRAAGINVEVETGHPYNLVFPGDPAPRLVLTNNLGPIDGQVRWTVEGTLTGPQPPVTRPVKADVGEPIELEVVIPDTFDCYTVTAALLIDGQPPVELRPIPVARIEPHPVGERRATHDEFLFGVANGAAIGRNAEETVLYVELASTLGANYVRQTRKWPQIEPRPGEWNWKWMDAIVDSAEAHNIHVQTVVGKPATWAIRPENLDHPKKNRTTPQIDLYTSFLHTFVDRYGDRVRYYEVINEPDIGFYEGTVEEYLEVLRATHEVVSQRPGLVTMTGGFTGFVHGGRKRGFQETVLREAQDSFDLHTLHMHGVFPRFWNGLNDLVKRARDAAGVTEPMIFNETGMDTRFGPNHQAATLPKKAAAVRHHGAVGYVWFGLFDHISARGTPTRAGRTYGLFNVDFEPKPAALAYVTAARTIAQQGSTYEGQLDVGKGRFAFVFQREQGDFVTLAWTEDPALAEALHGVRIDGSPSNARVLDLFGNGRPADVISNEVVLPLRRMPVYLVTDTRPSVGSPVLRIDRITEEDDGHLSLSFAAGEELVTGPQRVEPSATDGLTDWLGSVNPAGSISYTLPGGGSGELLVPGPVFVLGGNTLEGTPDFVLHGQKHAYNRFDHDPNTIEFLWGGRPDASAEFWLATDDDKLEVKVLVIDDEHRPMLDGDVTLGDAVELYLQPLGQSDPLRLALTRDGTTAVAKRWSGDAWLPADDITVDLQQDGNKTIYHVNVPGNWSGGLHVDARVSDLDATPPGELQWEARLSLQPWQGESPVGTDPLELRF